MEVSEAGSFILEFMNLIVSIMSKSNPSRAVELILNESIVIELNIRTRLRFDNLLLSELIWSRSEIEI